MIRAGIYNPRFGTKEQIEDQLLYYYGSESTDEQLKQIGVAQGLAELCNSFDEHPVSWVKTTKDLIIVTRLEKEEQSASWRDGYWLFASVGLENSIPLVTRSLRDAYRLFRLANGDFAHCIENKHLISSWWTSSFQTWSPKYPLGSLGVLGYMRLVSGVISPDTVASIKNLSSQLKATDLLVSTQDYAMIWPGSELDFDSRLDIQNWLVYASSKAQLDLSQAECDEPEVDEQPEEPGEPEETAKVEIAKEPTQSPEPEYTEESGPGIVLEPIIQSEPEPEGLFSRFSLGVTSYLPSMPRMPTIPSMPTLPNLDFSDSVPTMDSLRKSIQLLQSPYMAPEKPKLPTSMIIQKAHVILNNRSYHLLAFQQNTTVFCFVSEAPIEWTTHAALGCKHIVRDLEGISFAHDPPSDYFYMVVDHNNCTVTSTIALPGSPEEDRFHLLLANVIDNNLEHNRVMRTRDNWWVYSRHIDAHITAMFCRQDAEADLNELTGNIERKTGNWIESFRRRRGI